MATLTLTGDGGRIAQIGKALERTLMENPTQATVSATIDSTAWTVTLPSGKVISV